MYSHARVGLKFGLGELGIGLGDNILIPNYICEAVLQPLRELSISWCYYQMTDDFKPVWIDLHKHVDERTRAVLMVHYFGQPQDIGKYISFCEKYNLSLIEDNAHGHSGRLNNQTLGTFGDLGISSPRKIVGTETGGVVYISGRIAKPGFDGLEPYKSSVIGSKFRTQFITQPARKAWLRKVFKRMPRYDLPGTFTELKLGDWTVDERSCNVIQKKDWKKVAEVRRFNWSKWSQYSTQQGLLPIWVTPSSESCPWAMPAYATSVSERNRWLEWSWRCGLGLFPWPSLPDELIVNNPTVLERWQRLICFPLDTPAPRNH